ncbi:MAG: RNA chaperone Hfq [Geminicoccaceae bacterium]
MRLGTWLVGALTGVMLATPVLAAAPGVARLPVAEASRLLVADFATGQLQDRFLRQLRNSRTPVTIFLVNGVKLQGVITAYDRDTILVSRDANEQLVYKNAIAVILPGAPDPT